MAGHTVDPHQFLGLEINPRAAAIAELVLWIGYLQWHFRTKGGIPEQPILRKFKNIEVKNAVLTWDGYPTPQYVGGNEAYPNPKRPTWPLAEFIVGNPPFIGGKDIRSRLSPECAKALWAAHAHINESADFVMYWWDRAAELLTRKGSPFAGLGWLPPIQSRKNSLEGWLPSASTQSKKSQLSWQFQTTHGRRLRLMRLKFGLR